MLYQPLLVSSLGTNFRIHSVFYNDNWRVNNHLTVNAGLRWDRNHGVNSLGVLTANDSAVSPRAGIVFDPKGDGTWAITASFGKDVAAVANTIADASSSAGNTASYTWNYTGPQINVDTTVASPVTSAAAIQTVMDWCRPDAQGVCAGPNVPAPARMVPGVSRTIPDSLASPHALEYAAGISRRLGERASVRADFMFRDFRDFYSERIDTSYRHRRRFAGRPIRQVRDRKLQRSETPIHGRDVLGHVSPVGTDRPGRQLHAVSAVGQFRRREPRQRSARSVSLPIPRVCASVLELSGRGPVG